MGRRAGVTAEETRTEVLAAAARVFARSGYEGASIADITAEAGLSRGAIYGNYESKAVLFAAVLEGHGRRQVERLLGEGGLGNVADLVSFVGSTIDRREPEEVALLVEAIAASKRDPEVAVVVQKWFVDRERDFAWLVNKGQADGVLDHAVSAGAVARFSTMLALGSLLVAALDLPPADHDDWTALIARLVDSVRTTSSDSEEQESTHG